MTLMLYRQDLQEQFNKLDFDEGRFEHFKEYAQNATRHCAVATFANNSILINRQQKEISPAKENE